MANANTITIGHTAKLNIVVYSKEPVLTFDMIDQVHARKSGTARYRFNDHKARFTPGKHYYLVKHAEAEALKPYGIDVPPRGLTLITKRGYLLLVKSFTDDLAWEVQEQLVDHYFEGQPQPYKPEPAPEVISDQQYSEIKEEIARITTGFHLKNHAEKSLMNLLRFKLNVGNVKEIPAKEMGLAKQVLFAANKQAQELLNFRIELEEIILQQYVCQGIPHTGHVRRKYRREFGERLPRCPQWEQVAEKLELMPPKLLAE